MRRAPRQEQENYKERSGRKGYDRDWPPTGVASHGESHRERRQQARRDDQQERDPLYPAVPGVGATATQHRDINPKRGQDQRHPKQHQQHDRHATRPLLRQPIAYRDGQNHDQQTGNNKVATCPKPYGPRASELGHGTCSPPTRSES
jgi:hypothetical protein